MELKDALPEVGGGKLEVALGMLVDARIAGVDRQRRYRLRARDGGQGSTRDAMAKAAAQFEAMSVHDKETLQQMIDYAQTGQCRWRAILAYYGDTPSMQRCGVCDNCMSPPQIAPAEQSIAVGDTAFNANDRPDRRSHTPWSPGDVVRVPRFWGGEKSRWRTASRSRSCFPSVERGPSCRIF